MLTLTQVQNGAKIVADDENMKIFGYKVAVVKAKKAKKNPSVIVEMERLDGHKPGSQEAIEAMRVMAESDLDVFTGKPGEECPESCFETADGIGDAMFDKDDLMDDYELLLGNKLATLFRGV